MSETKKITFVSEVESITFDAQTGEVSTTATQKTKNAILPKEPNFIKVYLDHLGKYKGVQVSLTPILEQLLNHTSYANIGEDSGGMILYLNKALKSNIAKSSNISLTRVDHAVTAFVKKGYMRRIEIGMYQFNPFLFGKGEWKDIENIRTTFDYGTGEILADIVKHEEIAMNKATDAINAQSEKMLENQKQKVV